MCDGNFCDSTVIPNLNEQLRAMRGRWELICQVLIFASNKHLTRSHAEAHVVKRRVPTTNLFFHLPYENRLYIMKWHFPVLGDF